MTRKAITYFFIVFGLLVLWASTSRTAMKWLTDRRDNELWWGMYPCVHGDLVSMSYLDFVRRFNPPGYQRRPHFRKAPASSRKKLSLLLCGDSQTWHLDDSNFTRVARFQFINRSNGGQYLMDTTQDNVLIIEIAERYVRTYFSDTRMLDQVKLSYARDAAAPISYLRPRSRVASFPGIDAADFFNPYINQNIQCNLFNYNCLMPVFEWKAALNYYVFNRASGDVIISDDRQYLLLRETTLPEGAESSYSKLDNKEVDSIVASLNTLYAYYIKAGFREVLFTIVPNTTSLLQPNGYNQLIPKIEQHPLLKPKVVDVYQDFRNSREECFYAGDTHWNPKGKQRWLDLVNARLAQL